VSSSQPTKQEEEEGSHCQAPDLQNRWHRFWAVWLFRCEGASPEIPEISSEIPDIPETPEKSPEIPGITDKFVLSGDFSGLAYSPPPPLGDINILSDDPRVLFIPRSPGHTGLIGASHRSNRCDPFWDFAWLNVWVCSLLSCVAAVSSLVQFGAR
jgi:hypothetical protein